ncbi:hypothetical protein E4U17_006238 [Claviceps sp. LM77 group G4]|nr:hypothetical protein E4U17_006238 [Claviceps sp. LM77 group G4]KAG6074879.1 hypothetical protein E4U16_003712 [Claviceps sp. LM84 group G4]KAG6080816.1 hypothetical protein E4U33_007272 [Claviceps sp. LM78 group G4]
MPVQRTFTIVPPPANTRGVNALHQPAQHVRPMTSKQAQKAYKAATRGPPISRAEQRERDRAEQERIRKEFEKEKATAKARLARERKKEKESAEREKKKKKGMPLVSVRPSQDTIARFVRGNGSGKKRTCGGGAVGEGSDADGGDVKDVSAPKDRAEEQVALPDEDNGAPELDLIEEEEGDIESGLEELLDAISREQCEAKHRKLNEDEISHKSGPALPSGSSLREPREEEIDAVSPPSNPPPSLPACHRPRTPHIPQASPRETANPAQELESIAVPQQTPSPPLPPMSTQTILGNLDDFFPSPSQQARELQDDSDPDLYTSTPCKEAGQKSPRLSGQASQATSPPPRRRFFTPSGTNELVSLAIQRSRRTAALYEIQQQEKQQQQQQQKQKQLPKQTRQPLSQNRIHTNILHPPAKASLSTAHKMLTPDPGPGNAPTTAGSVEKENVQLQDASPQMSLSQESEYGGEWVDDLALQFII